VASITEVRGFCTTLVLDKHGQARLALAPVEQTMTRKMATKILPIVMCVCTTVSPGFPQLGLGCCEFKLLLNQQTDCCSQRSCDRPGGDALASIDPSAPITGHDGCESSTCPADAGDGDCCKTCKTNLFLASDFSPQLKVSDSTSHAEAEQLIPNCDFSSSLFRPPRI